MSVDGRTGLKKGGREFGNFSAFRSRITFASCVNSFNFSIFCGYIFRIYGESKYPDIPLTNDLWWMMIVMHSSLEYLHSFVVELWHLQLWS